MDQPRSFHVVTLNILYDPLAQSWPDRAPLVAAGLRALRPDIVLLQEVAWPNEQASELAALLTSNLAFPFAAHITPLITPHGWQEALAILSRFPLLERDELRFPDAEAFCQRIRVTIGDRAVDLYNMHLDPYSSDRRLEQIRLLLPWMESHEGAGGIVFGGDLNARPESDEIGLLRATLRSAHVTIHSHEPVGTVPTPFGAKRNRALVPIHTLDYLWHTSDLSVTECRLTFDQPDPRDPLLYASDHYGLLAEFRLPSDQCNSMR
ncbi:MAG: endonuclease/exonuclease/phosphatase family protein [Thermomicrobiales bacterium]